MKKIFSCFLIFMFLISMKPTSVMAEAITELNNNSICQTTISNSVTENNPLTKTIIIEKCPDNVLTRIRNIKNNIILMLILLTISAIIIVINSLRKNLKILHNLNNPKKVKKLF